MELEACWQEILRITLSLAVILVETTQNANFLVPILIVCFFSKYVGYLFNIAIVYIGIESAHNPLVEVHPPKEIKQVTAGDIASRRSKLKYC